jgi:hypothetical protein
MDPWDDDLDLGDDEDEDGGEELSGDDDEGEEVGIDYAVSDRGVQVLSGERGAALMRPELSSAVRLDGMPSKANEKKLSGDADIVRITVHFANGRKLHITP